METKIIDLNEFLTIYIEDKELEKDEIDFLYLLMEMQDDIKRNYIFYSDIKNIDFMEEFNNQKLIEISNQLRHYANCLEYWHNYQIKA